MSYLDRTRHTRKYGGSIYYVSKLGNDANLGTSPSEPLLTIGAAIGKLSEGDAINVMAGTYTETGLDLDVDNCEMWFEIGVIIDPISSTALTISGNYCKLVGQCLITPAVATTGIAVSGSSGYFEDIFVAGGATGWSITNTGNELRNCRSINATSTGFDIQAGLTRFINCNTGGTGTATIGFKINNGADKGLVYHCTSVAHGTSGFYIDTGSKDWTILDSSSGAGDGPKHDADSANVWSGYNFDTSIYKEIDLSGTGAQTANIFKITGAVRILSLMAHVSTVLSDNITGFGVKLYSAGGSENITGQTRTLSSAPVGSMLEKNARRATNIDYVTSGQPNVDDDTNERYYRFMCVKDNANDTFIQMSYSTTNDPCSGALHWHCTYLPLTEDGFVEAA